MINTTVRASKQNDYFEAIADDPSARECQQAQKSPGGPNRSIYMTEKSARKMVMKDGDMVLAKAQRKDKGKFRVTAYMLWSQSVRPKMKELNPDLDFAALSRRLGEMWSHITVNERRIWKRRSNRATKIKALPASTSKQANPSKFLNKGTSNNPNNQSVIPDTSPSGGNIGGSASTKHTKGVHSSPETKSNRRQQGSKRKNVPRTCSEPIDVAAHLKLLGDSLSTIGESLKNHDGKVAVAGTLSVLLDSLLCSVVPLMCLAPRIQQLAGREGVKDLKDTLTDSLDNIAFIMPGV